MADLLVHFATVYGPGQAFRDARLRAILYVGVCLPDILYKLPLYLAGSSTWYCEPTHSPLGMAAICYAAALLFEEPWRKRAFFALTAGSWLHLLADLGKNYMHSGVILWGFPFTMDRAELAWYYPEETVYLMLPSLVLILLVESGLRLRRRKGSSAT